LRIGRAALAPSALPDELVYDACNVSAWDRPNPDFPRAVDALGQLATDARVAEQACDHCCASVPDRAGPADIDAKQIALDGPDREPVWPSGPEFTSHALVIGLLRDRLKGAAAFA